MNEKATQLDHEPQDIIFKKKLITIEKGDFRTMNHFNLLGDYRVESRSYQNTIKWFNDTTHSDHDIIWDH